MHKQQGTRPPEHVRVHINLRSPHLCSQELGLELHATRLDGLLDRPHHLLNVVSNVLLARALEGDLGAHDAHKHADL